MDSSFKVTTTVSAAFKVILLINHTKIEKSVKAVTGQIQEFNLCVETINNFKTVFSLKTGKQRGQREPGCLPS